MKCRIFLKRKSFSLFLLPLLRGLARNFQRGEPFIKQTLLISQIISTRVKWLNFRFCHYGEVICVFFCLRYGYVYDAQNIHKDAQNFSTSCSKVVPKLWGPCSESIDCGRNWKKLQLCFEKLTKRNYTGVSSTIVILTTGIFNQKYYTTSGDKHCKLSRICI